MTVNGDLLMAALAGYELQRQHIEQKIKDLRASLGVASPVRSKSKRPGNTPAAPVRARRKMSAAARERIAAAQRKRWAASKKRPGASPQPAAPEAPKAKRTLSAAGRKRIIEAAKKRWAAVRAKAQ